MTSNLLLGYPDIPFRATTQTANKTASTSLPLSQLTAGDRQRLFELATATGDDLWINYALSATSTSQFFALLGAKELQKKGCTRISLRGSAQSAFTPSSISGLKLHLDATRGVTVDSANKVSAWADQSGQGNNASQATTSKQPLYSRADNKENRVLSSANLADLTAWPAFSCSTTAATIADPITGLMTGITLVENSGTATHQIVQTIPYVFFAGVPYEISVFAKKKDRDFIGISCVGAAPGFGIYYNINTGAVGSVVGATVTGSIVSIGSGWYQCKAVFTPTASAVSDFRISHHIINGGSSYLGDGASGTYFCRPVCKEAAADSTYVETTTAPQLRGVNGLRTVMCDGVDDYLSVNGLAASLTGDDQPYSALIVAQVPNTTSTYTLFSVGNSGAANPHISAATKTGALMRFERADNTGGGVGTDSPSALTTATQVHSWNFPGTTVSYWADGVNKLNAATHNALALTLNIATIGALGKTAYTNFFAGRIMEVIVFSSSISTSDRQALEAYLTAKWVTAPTVSNVAFSSATLYGPRSEDYITTFSTTSAYANWWVQMSNDATAKYRHSKQFFGTWFDMGRDPEKGAAIQRAQTVSNPRDLPYRFPLTWKGVTPTVVNSLVDKILKYRDVCPVIVYDAADVFLNDHRLLYCQIVGSQITPNSAAAYDVRLDFQEVI